MSRGPLVWLLTNERDLVIAGIFAILGAIVWDILKSGSLIGVRQLRNWLSDISVGRLRKRISDLEKYRTRIVSFASSDKALYLAVLQSVVVILAMMCLATISFVFDLVAQFIAVPYGIVLLGPQGAFAACGVGILAIAIVVGLNALIYGGLDTPERIAKKVSELDSEIAGLRVRLDARLQKGEK